MATKKYDVFLQSFDLTSKIALIKVVRDAITGIGHLREAKDLVDAAPCTLQSSITKSRADALKVLLEAAGGTVELIESKKPKDKITTMSTGTLPAELQGALSVERMLEALRSKNPHIQIIGGDSGTDWKISILTGRRLLDYRGRTLMAVVVQAYRDSVLSKEKD
jgi:hypothetical protein